MTLEIGDLVACYLTNTEEYESLMSWGVVLDRTDPVGDVLVIDNMGYARWYPEKRWRILNKKTNNFIDLDDKK